MPIARGEEDSFASLGTGSAICSACHCEEQSDVAIQSKGATHWDCFSPSGFAMTGGCVIVSDPAFFLQKSGERGNFIKLHGNLLIS